MVEARLYAPETDVISKKEKKGRHLNFRCKVGRNLEPPSAASCGFIKRPVFNHKIMVSLTETQLLNKFGVVATFILQTFCKILLNVVL